MNKDDLMERLGFIFNAEDTPHRVRAAEKLIDQYAYEYAERVIGDGELHVSHVCPQDSIPCREFGARGRLRNAQHKRNKELSPHRATKDGEGEV